MVEPSDRSWMSMSIPHVVPSRSGAGVGCWALATGFGAHAGIACMSCPGPAPRPEVRGEWHAKRFHRAAFPAARSVRGLLALLAGVAVRMRLHTVTEVILEHSVSTFARRRAT